MIKINSLKQVRSTREESLEKDLKSRLRRFILEIILRLK